MITLVFLVCYSTCEPVANSNIFRTKEECQAVAEEIIQDNMEAARREELPRHTADYQCINWEKI